MGSSRLLGAALVVCFGAHPSTSLATSQTSLPFKPEQKTELVNPGGLRGRPQTASPITVPLSAGTIIKLQSRLTNGSGIWWYASTQEKSGWIPENNLIAVQAAPAAPADREPTITAAMPVETLDEASAPAPAQDAEDASAAGQHKTLAFVFDLGIESGGDDVATVFFTDGSSQDLEAGQGLVAGLGFSWMPSATVPFDVRTTIGYKYATTAADNVDISISRVMMSVVPTYHLNADWWIAAGVERHLSTKFDADGLIESVDFDDATGFTLQAGYKYFAVRYLNISYEGPFSGDVDGSAIGLLLTATLR